MRHGQTCDEALESYAMPTADKAMRRRTGPQQIWPRTMCWHGPGYRKEIRFADAAAGQNRLCCADKADGRNRLGSSVMRSRFRPSRVQVFSKRCCSNCAQTPLPFMRVEKSAS